ncbi:MAG: mannitol-1-phosphate 5-dehydrogenase [Paenibacillaceae bacterium]|nr:mannitol-1-phosphate 5-dehydrogenase [Paenibacillaceae bacterium]
MKAVHFGAGKIGRGLVGLLLSQTGYEVVFVARNDKQIRMMQERGRYTVIMANAAKETAVVNNITAIHVGDEELVGRTVAAADLITTAVGAASLPQVGKTLARGIVGRLLANEKPLHIIACENALGGSRKLKEAVFASLPRELHARADRQLAFPGALIDRIVPEQQSDDPLTVKVEPFYEWIIHRPEVRKGFHGIRGVQYADVLEPFAERKLFTVNTGHCSAAYFGYAKGYKTIQETLNDAEVRRQVEGVMRETGGLLMRKFGLAEAEHDLYIRRTLERFANPSLTDKVTRVGRSPLRKLSSQERLVLPAMQALGGGAGVPHLTAAMAAGLRFDPRDDAEAMRLQTLIRDKGVGWVIERQMGIPAEHELHGLVARRYERQALQ